MGSEWVTGEVKISLLPLLIHIHLPGLFAVDLKGDLAFTVTIVKFDHVPVLLFILPFDTGVWRFHPDDDRVLLDVPFVWNKIECGCQIVVDFRIDLRVEKGLYKAKADVLHKP